MTRKMLTLAEEAVVGRLVIYYAQIYPKLIKLLEFSGGNPIDKNNNLLPQDKILKEIIEKNKHSLEWQKEMRTIDKNLKKLFKRRNALIHGILEKLDEKNGYFEFRVTRKNGRREIEKIYIKDLQEDYDKNMQDIIERINKITCLISISKNIDILCPHAPTPHPESA